VKHTTPLWDAHMPASWSRAFTRRLNWVPFLFARRDQYRVAWATAVVATMFLAWIVAVDSQAANAATRNLFYLPIILGAFRYGFAGATILPLVAGLLAGPLAMLPPEVAATNTITQWGIRPIFYLIGGLTIAGLTQLTRDAYEAHAEAMREQAAQRLLVIQTLSHEIRTPVTVINGGLETLQHDTLDDASRRRIWDGIQRASRRLDALAHAVLASAGYVEDGQSEGPVDVYDLLANIYLTMDRYDARRRLRVDVDTPTIQAPHPELLRYITTELVANALRYSPGDRPVELHLANGDGIAVRVRDYGSGIPQDQL
jgi:signal transduction histidine kinase